MNLINLINLLQYWTRLYTMPCQNLAAFCSTLETVRFLSRPIADEQKKKENGKGPNNLFVFFSLTKPCMYILSTST